MAGNEVSRPIHVLFNGDNFSQWSQAISSYLKGRKLWCYVSGVRTIPVKEEKESDATYDLRLKEWESSNHQIITWFRNTSIPSIIDEFSNLCKRSLGFTRDSECWTQWCSHLQTHTPALSDSPRTQ